MVIRWLLKWTPFKIDALGLITILGADEVNRSIGRLSRSRLTEYLPLVSSFVIANDSIRSAIPGFALYNISDGICAFDFAGWFSRWLLSQDLTYNSTTLIMNIRHPVRPPGDDPVLAACIGMTISFVMILLPALMADWWGLANAISLGISVLVRSTILKANRDAINRAAETAVQQSRTVIKAFCNLTNGRSVTIYAPRGIITQCLLSDPRPSNPRVYFAFRMIGWAAFLVHIISLGMAALPNQLLTVSILAVSTVCVVLRVGSNDESIGQKLVIRRIDHQGPERSMAACFARLRLSTDEEEAMVAWRLMPQFRNEAWWRKYRASLAQNSSRAFDDWAEKRTWDSYENLLLQEANQKAALGKSP